LGHAEQLNLRLGFRGRGSSRAAKARTRITLSFMDQCPYNQRLSLFSENSSYSLIISPAKGKVNDSAAAKVKKPGVSEVYCGSIIVIGYPGRVEILISKHKYEKSDG
jgi:hypothetical protein